MSRLGPGGSDKTSHFSSFDRPRIDLRGSVRDWLAPYTVELFAKNASLLPKRNREVISGVDDLNMSVNRLTYV